MARRGRRESRRLKAAGSYHLRGGGTGGPSRAFEKGRKALNDLAAAVGFDASRAFGCLDEVAPIDHLIGAMAGWAGQPSSTPLGIIDSVDLNDGETHDAVTVRDAPVDAFRPITVYNADGYLEPDALGRNRYDNVSAKPNADGSCTIRFGGREYGRINCIPISAGWNYTIRLHQPRAEILGGSWSFPKIVPVG